MMSDRLATITALLHSLHTPVNSTKLQKTSKTSTKEKLLCWTKYVVEEKMQRICSVSFDRLIYSL